MRWLRDGRRARLSLESPRGAPGRARRILLVAPAGSYRTRAYLEAAAELAVDVTLVSNGRHSVVPEEAGGLHVDLADPAGAARRVRADGEGRPIDAVLCTDDGATLAAATIAEALGLCAHWAGNEKVCVILGDNLIEKNIVKAVSDFKAQGTGAKILLKEVHDPERFGVARLDGEKVAEIIEKPKDPPSNLAVIGIYMYDGRVWDIIRTLEPSDRGELEITDVNNWYIRDGSMTFEVLDGWWTDAGTFESLFSASKLVADGGANNLD